MSERTDAVSTMIAETVVRELAAWQNGTKRTAQSSARVLGMSDLGGCREFIRATIAGDPRKPEAGLKWPAFVGTAVGDLAERALHERVGAVVQDWVTVELPQSGIQVSGNTDAVIFDDHLVDFKTKDRLDSVMTDGPDYGQKVQVSGYFVGKVQSGDMTEAGTASLVFLDRSGAQPYPYVWTITYAQALSYLDSADERLTDVANALATGKSQGELRDKPESWCYHVQCPFYEACWGDEEYNPTGVIDAPEHIAAMEKYDRGRAMAKAGEGLQREAKHELGAYAYEPEPPSGQSEDFTLKWTLYENGPYVNRRIDLRRKRKK